MFKKKPICVGCNSKVNDSFDFCPYCGTNLSNPEKDARDFGMLGKNEITGYPVIGGGGLGITDKMINSLMKSLMKAFEGTMKDVNADVQSSPGKIKIRFGAPGKKQQTRKINDFGVREITDEQIERMSGLPRVEGKTDVRRLSDKVIYEIKAPGLDDVKDVFLSKLESGYEVKAIGKKKVYVNSLPINLPLKGYFVENGRLVVEFKLSN